MEIWKPIPSMNGFEASSWGRIRAADYLAQSKREGQVVQLRKGGIRSPWLGRNGYFAISVQRQGKRPKFLVHRLVCEAFHGRSGLTVDHLNGNRTDNRPENLEWVSRAENTLRQNEAGRGVAKGESHPGAKLSDDQAQRIPAMRQAGMTYAAIARQFSVSASLIHKISTGKRRAVSIA